MKIFIFLITFFLFTNTTIAQNYTIIENKAILPIFSPSKAKQKIEKIRLSNHLEVVLISDPQAKLSGAVMSVKVGSWEDPEEHPGLAHFLEHMLFLGTKTFPEESMYNHYINEHGGQTNAFTTNDTTNYLFTVSNDAFEHSLEIFSSFFKEPLFNPSGVSRELNAIDQEYAKNLENDQIRQLYVLKELSNPEHPFHHFNMGNSQSLKNVTKQALENWYHQHYSANLMRLLVYSPLPLEELRTLVVNKFSDVPNTNQQPFEINTKTFTSAIESKYVYIEPIKDTRTLTLVWELPIDFSKMIKTKPDSLVCHILGHEGEKSLLAQLKEENLAEALGCGATKLGNYMTLLFLQVELTSKGLKHVEQVITHIFQTIKTLQEKNVPNYLFEEVKQMETINYQYQSKENEFLMLLNHGYRLHDEAIATYPEHSLVIQKFDPDKIQALVNFMTPKNAAYFIQAPSQATGVIPTERERWLGVPYSVKSVPHDLITKWSNVLQHKEIDLPLQNPFIPKSLQDLKKQPPPVTQTFLPKPKLIDQTEKTKIYFSQDTQFGIPKVSWHINLLTPEITMTDPTKIVLGELYIKLLKENLNKYSYPAKLAGLDYKIKRDWNGISIEIEGYALNASILLEKIIETMTTFTPSRTNFFTIKDTLLRKYTNFTKESPLDQAIELFRSMLYQNYVTEKEKAAVIRKVSFKQFQEFSSHLFDRLFVQGMLYGSMQEETSKEALNSIYQAFKQSRSYPEIDHEQKAVLILPDDGPYFLEARAQAQGNATLLAIETPSFSFKERAAQQILMQGVKEPFFSTLRTKQQTGYLVHSIDEEVERKLFNLFLIQSNSHEARDLLSRFEAFIEGFLQEFGTSILLEEEFQNIKQSLVKKMEEPAKNINEMGVLLNKLAFEYNGDFDWMEKRIDGIKQLTYSEFVDLARMMLGRENKRRLAILIEGQIPQNKEFQYKRARNQNMLKKASNYQVH